MSRVVRALAAALLLLGVSAAPAQPAGIKIQEVVSPGGIRAWLVEDHSRTIITMKSLFRGGSHLDPDGKAGLAAATAWMLTEGAGDMDIEAFNTALEDNAIEINFTADTLAVVGEMRTLTRNRDKAFDLFSLALTRPRFDPDSISIAKEQLRSAIRNNRENPTEIAEQRWYQEVFPGQPFGQPRIGTIESVDAITRADMQKFAAERFSRDVLYIAVVGDITPAELAPLLDSTFGPLPAKARPLGLPEAAPKLVKGLKVVDRDVSQSAVYFGGPGPLRASPDFPALLLANHIFGAGAFTSRLYLEVREDRGLAYAIDTNLSFSDRVGLVVGRVGTANASVAKSIEIVRSEWAKIGREGVTEKELEDAKRYLTGSFWVSYLNTREIAGKLAWVQYHGFGTGYFTERNKRVEAVTLDDIRAVTEKYYDPEKLFFVVVGRPEGLKSE